MAMHSKPDHFPYTALDSGQHQIRLITLLPGWVNSPIRCTIAPATMKLSVKRQSDSELKTSAPTWEALSYTWGNPSDTVLISVNDRPFEVTRNLFSALLRLRYVDRHRTLWVDAICIDQSNLAERSVQVQQMPLIYQSAHRVLIWLGEADDFDLLAVAILNDLIEPPVRSYLMDAASGCICVIAFLFWGVKSSITCFLLLSLLKLVSIATSLKFHRLKRLSVAPFSDREFGARYRATCKTFRQAGMREDLANTIESLGQDRFFHLIFRRFAGLLDRPWFSRMWIVQEASNAKELTVLVGNCSIGWDRFCLIQRWILARHRVLSLGPDLYISVLGLELVAFFRRLLTSSLEGLDLLPCLHICRGFQATDPRDKIYAMTGLLSVNARTDAFNAGILIPDYELSVRDVYMNLTRWHIAQSKTLEILNFALEHDQNNEHRLPSWVPDWSIQKHTVTLQSASFGQRRYEATLGASPLIHDSLEADTLVLSGMFLDEVKDVVDNFHDLKSIGLPKQNTWLEWNQFHTDRHQSRSSFAQKRESLEAYWLTLVSGAPTAIDTGACWQFFCLFFSREDELPLEFQDLGMAEEFRESCPTGEIPFSMLTSYSKTSFVHPKDSKGLLASAIDNIAEGLLQTLQGRKLFATRKGRLGVGPATTCMGDKIVLLMGADLPFLIQQIDKPPPVTAEMRRRKKAHNLPLPEYHSLVGECYVHGLQNGEGMAIAREKGLKVDKVILK